MFYWPQAKLLGRTFSLRHHPNRVLLGSNSLGSMPKRHVVDEIISDSEPEREALRRRAREKRRTQKSFAKLTVPKVIELTDSDSTDSIIVPSKGGTIIIDTRTLICHSEQQSK